MAVASSMTGFGRGDNRGAHYVVSVEIKSVNHRFKEIRIRGPKIFSFIEIKLKELVGSYCKRGSFDISINLQSLGTDESFFSFDRERVKRYIEVVDQISKESGVNVVVTASDFFRDEFKMTEMSSEMKGELEKQLMIAFNKACSGLTKLREIEGEKLVAEIQKHLSCYKDNLQLIDSKKNLYRNSIELKLKESLKRAVDTVDEGRMLQEVVYYLEKLDIVEEIGRINSHITKVEELIINGGEIGRTLDFFVQELNRETNTIGSKSGELDISSAVVNMKVQLEKIREQGLNLE